MCQDDIKKLEDRVWSIEKKLMCRHRGVWGSSEVARGPVGWYCLACNLFMTDDPSTAKRHAMKIFDKIEQAQGE